METVLAPRLTMLRRHPRLKAPAAAASFFSALLEVAGVETSAAGLDAAEQDEDGAELAGLGRRRSSPCVPRRGATGAELAVAGCSTSGRCWHSVWLARWPDAQLLLRASQQHPARDLLRPSSRLPVPAMAARRLLLEAAAAAGTQQPDSLSSDLVLILAGLLCALVCVLGLALVARCACSRRWANAAAPSSPPGANRGVKKEVLRALPTVAYAVPDGGAGAEADECAICLAEFEDGQLMRVLPQCGHGFHAPCVDAWLRSHSSCPSCRRVLVAAELPRGEPCGRCGARPGAIGALLKGPCSGGALASLLA